MVCTEVKEPAGGIIGARGKGIATWEELKRKKTKKQHKNNGGRKAGVGGVRLVYTIIDACGDHGDREPGWEVGQA